MLKALSHFERFQDGTNLRAWLFTILRNSYLTGLRKHRREVEDADGNLAAAFSVPPSQDDCANLGDLHKAIGKLPLVQHEALLMVGALGMSYTEVAHKNRCAIGTVKSRVNRARQNIARTLGMDAAMTTVHVKGLRVSAWAA